MRPRARASALALTLVVLAAVPGSGGHPPAALDPFDIYADGFRDLRGLVADAEGHLYVADRADGTVTRIAPDGSHLAVAAGLDRPIGLALDLAGRLLVAEERAGRVVRIEPDGRRTSLVSGIEQPRWLAVHEDGTLFIAARALARDTAPEPDDESAEPEMILALTPDGDLGVFADGFQKLQGLAADRDALFAATGGRREERGVRGVVFRIPIEAGGTAGAPMPYGPSDQLRKPVSVVLDHLGALYVATTELTLVEDRSRRAIAKLGVDGRLTRFADNLEQPQGLAFDPHGHLYLADGRSGRIIRFHAPPAPVITTPGVTGQSPVTITGTAQPGARVDLFLNDALPPVSVIADAAGAFSASLALAENAVNALAALATTHGGRGLTSLPAEMTLVHDARPPVLLFQTPPAGAHVRETVSVRVHASDADAVASLGVAVDGQALSLATTPAPPAPALDGTAAWTTSGVPDGVHTLSASATDQAGNAATATRVVVVDNTPPDTSVTEGPGGTFTFAGSDALTPAESLTFAWRLDDGPFTPFSPDTSVTLEQLPEGPHRLEVKARDRAGNEDPTPASRTFTVGGLRVTIVEPLDGSTVPAGLLLVRGTVETGGQEVGVAIEGTVAAVEGTTFVAEVPVAPGVTALTATATSTLSGATASDTVALTVSPVSTPAPGLSAAPATGVAPLRVRFSLLGLTPPAVTLDLEGDGTVDFTASSLDDHDFTYQHPGLYFPRVVVTDGQGGQTTLTTVVHVEAPAAVTARFRALWAGFKDRVAAGDVPGATRLLLPPLAQRMEVVLQELGPDAGAVAGALGDLEVLEQSSDLAEAVVLQQEDGRASLYFIYFRRDSRGRWLIEEM